MVVPTAMLGAAAARFCPKCVTLSWTRHPGSCDESEAMKGCKPAPTCLAAAPQGPARVDGRGARDCIKRALDAAKAALASNTAAPGLPALARAAGVSSRTLQRHFSRVLGLSPHSVVQRLRLDS